MTRRGLGVLACLGFAALLSGCKCGSESDDASPAPAGKEKPEAPLLAPAPGYSLIDNLERCDIYHRGLSMDFGTDSVNWRRSYALGPFDDVENVEREGATFARVRSRRVVYVFHAEETENLDLLLGARVHGLTARRMTAYIDKKVVGSVRLTNGETKVFELGGSTTELAAGHHTLLLDFPGPARGDAPRAEVDWVRLGEKDDLSTTYAAPTLKDVVVDHEIDGKPRRSVVLRAPSSLRCALQPAADSVLRFQLGFWGNGTGLSEIRVLPLGEEPVVLSQRKVTGGAGASWLPVELPLGKFASRLVTLELNVLEASRGGRIVFGEPQVTRKQNSAKPVPRAHNVVLVIASGQDRRRLPPWGQAGNKPALRELARTGVAFTNYRAPTTVPAAVVASLLSGLPPRATALEDQAARLPKPVRTLAHMIKEASGRSAMFTGVPTTFASFGFDAGWDKFEVFSPVEDLPATEPFAQAAKWVAQELEDNPKGERVLVLHVRGGHPPWDLSKEEADRLKPDEYAGVLDPRRGGITLANIRAHSRRRSRRLGEQDWIRLHELWEKAMEKQDQGLATLMRALKDGGAWDQTLFIYVGDVALGDPPDLPFDPAGALSEDRLMVPLLVKFPGGEMGGKESPVPVGSVDITRTIIESLGLKPPERLAGADLFAAASGAEPLVGRLQVATLGSNYASRLGHWLLRGTLGKRPTLCQLDVDPACLDDVFDKQPAAARILWRWTYDAEQEARKERLSPREAASIEPALGAALTVWGDVQ